ncbi:MAG TPA: DUF5666 domain-containing protein [Mycobacteriales bacterium]|nr:DUF5666 domain-containing protein [Mycobacteriales bacterium]
MSGKVIAASATSATVQAASGPSTVAFTTSTRFTKSSPTQRSSLAKGDCVTVASTDATVPTARSTSGATSNGILRPPRKVTARSVTVTSTSGCRQTGQFRDGFTGTPPPDGPRFGNGEVPRPFATGTPPSGAGSNAQRPGIVRNRLGVGVLGTITSISGTTFTVASTFAESAKTTVTTTADTTYDAIATVTAADIDRGACLSAVGSTDVSGVLDARSVAISQPDNGTCRSAGPPFGGGRFFTSGGPGGVSEGGSGA